MRILYITTSLLRNESASIRNVSLINGLIENGCNITVLTLDFPKESEDNFLRQQIKKEVVINKIQIPTFNRMMKILHDKNDERPDSRCNLRQIILQKIKAKIKPFIFFPDTLCEGIKNADSIKISHNEYDYIISSSDSKTSHFIAKNIIKNNKLDTPWIQIWGDPWAKDIGLVDLNYFLKRKIMNAEKELLNKANKVFYVSELTANDIKKMFPNLKNKVKFLLRSYLQKIEKASLTKDNYIFSYTGSIINRNLTTLVNSVSEYNTNHKKRIELQFYGVNSGEIKQFSQLDFIKVFPRVSFEKVLEIYKNSDVLVYVDNLRDTTQIPGKIYDYFGTDKVILGLYENENIKQFLEKFNRVELYSNNKEFNLENIISKIGTQKPLEEFSPKYVACEFLKKIKGEE